MTNIQQAQEIMFETLLEVDKICKKHNLKYWLSSGTLLGAVREKDFIPWDDDLDICMLKDDYDIFLQVVPSLLKKDMFLQTKNSDSKFPYNFAKIRSNKGKIIEKHEIGKNIEYNQGIFIDIFPMLSVPSNKLFNYFYKFYFLFVKLFTYKYLNIEKIEYSLIQYFESKFHHKNNQIIIKTPKLPDSNMYIDKKEVFPLKKIHFHNNDFYAPLNTDNYLKNIFGYDYMISPSLEKRHFNAYKIEIYN
jgi:lipopolysaccharide cholinephosphotransferase